MASEPGHGASMLLEPGYSPSESEGETSVALGERPRARSAPSSTSAAATLDFEQIADAQRQIIEAQNQEILRLRQRVHILTQRLESAANAATDSEENLELDYSAMEADARLRAPSGVNWKTASRPKSYSEIMDIRYDPEAEER